MRGAIGIIMITIMMMIIVRIMMIIIVIMIIRRTEGTEEQGMSDPQHLSLLAS